MKRWILLLICFSLLWGKTECYGKESEKEAGPLYAASAVLMDGDSGRILYEKKGDEFLANASTTKILTCILALEMTQLEDIVTVSQYASTMPDVQLHIQEGEQYRMEDLLLSLMLESHNDVAVAIAEHVAKSCEEFSVLMNQKAKEIGCSNTYFLTPNGLDAVVTKGEEEVAFHGTTAEDLALIMRYCISLSPQKKEFIRITSTLNHRFSDMEGKREFFCQNHNSLFNLMEGVISGKTGFTGKAGYCYVGAVKKEGKTFIVALLGCGWPYNKHYKWEDCKTLIAYGNSAYQKVDLETAEAQYREEMKTLVENAKGSTFQQSIWLSMIREEREFSTVLLKPEEKIIIKVKKNSLKAPVEKGQMVGECRYYINDTLWRTERLYSEQDVEKVDFKWCIEMMIKQIV